MGSKSNIEVYNQLIDLVNNGISKEKSMALSEEYFARYSYSDTNLAYARMYEHFAMVTASIFIEGMNAGEEGIGELLSHAEEGDECLGVAEIVRLVREEVPYIGHKKTTPGELALLVGLYCYSAVYHDPALLFIDIYAQSWCQYFSGSVAE